jgi:hypothetical protein
VLDLSHELIWLSAVLGFVPVVLAVIKPVLNLLRATPIDWLTVLLSAVVLVACFVLIPYLMLIVYTTLAVTRDPRRLVSELAARILVVVPRPYTKMHGLDADGIRRLERIAQVEQNAADWRSAFVNVLIIGTVSAVVSMAPAVWKLVISSSPPDTADDWRSPWHDMAVEHPPWTDALWLVLAAAFAIWIAVSLYAYTRRFLAEEVANRSILLACEEALAVLEIHKLTHSTDFTLREKRALAAKFGCRLVSRKQALLFEILDGRSLWDPTGREWYLVPPRQVSTFAWLAYQWRHLRHLLHRHQGEKRREPPAYVVGGSGRMG